MVASDDPLFTALYAAQGTLALLTDTRALDDATLTALHTELATYWFAYDAAQGVTPPLDLTATTALAEGLARRVQAVWRHQQGGADVSWRAHGAVGGV